MEVNVAVVPIVMLCDAVWGLYGCCGAAAIVAGNGGAARRMPLKDDSPAVVPTMDDDDRHCMACEADTAASDVWLPENMACGGVAMSGASVDIWPEANRECTAP